MLASCLYLAGNVLAAASAAASADTTPEPVLAQLRGNALSEAEVTALARRPRGKGVNPNCTLSGFWDMHDNVVAHFLHTGYDMGSYRFVGRGQCKDSGARVYGSWSAPSGVDFAGCKATCDASNQCVGFEVATGGACYVRYEVEGVPHEAPGKLTRHDVGDDATGPIKQIGAPWSRSCYQKSGIELHVANTDGWRVIFYPRNGIWPYNDKDAKEAPLEISQSPMLNTLRRCRGALLHSRSPYVQNVTMWSGTLEIKLWAGIAANETAIKWRRVPDARAWDHTAALGGATCPAAVSVEKLVGEVETIQHVLWGFRNCNAVELPRLKPELVDLTSDGWSEVVGDKFKFGMEVFVRRLVRSKDRKVVDEHCFDQFLDSLWSEIDHLSLKSVETKLQASRCIELDD